MNSGMRVAIVHDALPFIGGAERVLLALLELFPQAPLYTLIYNPRAFNDTILSSRKVYTSFLQKVPLARWYHRWFLPFYPRAVESFDLSEYDLVISTSYAAAHGAITGPDQLHISYTHTPLRQAWQRGADFLPRVEPSRLTSSWPIQTLLRSFRVWDAVAARRPDRLIASSHWIAGCIWEAYWREAPVIYPPVDVDRFTVLRSPSPDSYYLAIARLEQHKRLEILLDAFNRLGYPLLVVGEGSQRRSLERRRSANVRLLGWVPDDQLIQLLSGARALVHAGVEDFGIALVEAQAAGCPVIAYARGGAMETVIQGQTGILYPEQTATCLADTVALFDAGAKRGHTGLTSPQEIRRSAMRFNKGRFQSEINALIDSTINPPLSLLLPLHIVPGSTTAPSGA